MRRGDVDRSKQACNGSKGESRCLMRRRQTDLLLSKGSRPRRAFFAPCPPTSVGGWISWSGSPNAVLPCPRPPKDFRDADMIRAAVEGDRRRRAVRRRSSWTSFALPPGPSCPAIRAPTRGRSRANPGDRTELIVAHPEFHRSHCSSKERLSPEILLRSPVVVLSGQRSSVCLFKKRIRLCMETYLSRSACLPRGDAAMVRRRSDRAEIPEHTDHS